MKKTIVIYESDYYWLRTWLDTQVDDNSPLTVLDVDAWIDQVNRNH